MVRPWHKPRPAHLEARTAVNLFTRFLKPPRGFRKHCNVLAVFLDFGLGIACLCSNRFVILFPIHN